MSGTKKIKPAIKNYARKNVSDSRHDDRRANFDSDAEEAATEVVANESLPPHPNGKAWKWRHIVAAKRAAFGHSWREIAAEVGVKECTAKGYTQADGWSVLFAHFRSGYIAELEDSLFEPALKALLKIVTSSDSEFAQLQAASLILSERNRTYGRIDKALRAPKDGDTNRAPIVVDNTIPAPSEATGEAASNAGSN